ncbi:DUF3761 domain-containing protein [Streptomyces gilvosporeus]|uniref:DUF3761 domain-containing protein n=1 Tax=Streptomyces gilvosporeus TaxID=553510 RepID=A0A1V0TWM5_9ACTN|nr:DUF3761 domain-containing protein [Streptomyces gilvosporeus]ARF57082.1 hypothetical protein B1H19_25515 [Streptomyces gilvosporeus]
MKARIAAGVAGILLALGSAGAASASAALPYYNTAHRCVHHTTAYCGWTHHKKPINKTETAKCRDNTHSYSRHSSGTCSHHRGVAIWWK